MAGKNNGTREKGLGNRDFCLKDQFDINTTSTLTMHLSPKSLLFFVFCSLFIVSCHTTQSPESYFHEGKIPLVSGANVYIVANVKEARSIIELLPIPELKSSQTKQMLDRTNFAMAALFPRESGRRFQMAAWGNYPSAGADMVLSADKNWKKQNAAGRSYWHSSADKLSISMTAKQAFVLGSLNNAPTDPFSAGAEAIIPDGFNNFRKGAALSFWINNPANSIQQLLNSAGIPLRTPVRHFFINLNNVNTGRAQRQYEAVLMLSFDNATQARGMLSILNLAGVVAPAASNIISLLFLSNPPVLDGANLIIKSNPLSEEILINILKMFS